VETVLLSHTELWVPFWRVLHFCSQTTLLDGGPSTTFTINDSFGLPHYMMSYAFDDVGLVWSWWVWKASRSKVDQKYF
jgi:hypothetical protein